MNEEILNNILRQIVIDMAPIPGRQVNAYAFIDRDPDLSGQSFGQTYEQYEAGYFWARSWVGAGASKSTFCGQYPVMFVEPGSARFDCPGDSEGVFPFNILIIDEIGCDGCPDHGKRSARQVAANVRSMLAAVITELSSFGKYIITDPDDLQPSTVWMSAGRAETPDMVPFDPEISTDMIGVLEPEPYTVQEWGNHPKRRAYFATLSFRWCLFDDGQFDYTNRTPDQVGVVNCPC